MPGTPLYDHSRYNTWHPQNKIKIVPGNFGIRQKVYL